MEIEKPKKINAGKCEWGSDYLAEVIRALDLKFVALTPGASFRGLHDSLVNHLGNENPRMLLCLHEEHAIAIAHGYAKVTGKPMGAVVHSNVGLMHASMAIFNAWCDRVPVLIFGATGAVDAALRRPWIEWIHTVKDQGALVRDFIKWDDQPASLPAAAESILRGAILAQTAPRAPVYICFDTTLQESRVSESPALPDRRRFQVPPPAQPAEAVLTQAAAMLLHAKNPVILAGRVSRDADAWRQRVELAETLAAKVLTDLKLGAAFPSDHPLHAAPPGIHCSEQAASVLRQADVVLSLDWVDLAGALRLAWKDREVAAQIIQCSVDSYIHNGWSMDYQALPPVDLHLLCEPDAVIAPLLAAVKKQRAKGARPRADIAPKMPIVSPAADLDGEIGIRTLSLVLQQAAAGEDACLIRLPLGWAGDTCHFMHPLDYLGSDGGGGVGSGPGMAVGAALALQGGSRLPIAVLGDGDFMMGVSAVWTAVHYRIPLLIVVANNRSFFNDEIHQEKVARQRARPVENKWIGQHIGDPDIDIAAIARAQGAIGLGPVVRGQELNAVLREAVVRVKAGATCVVDVRVKAEYAMAMNQALPGNN